MSEGIVQIGVDLVRRQVSGLPGQATNQNEQLGEIPGAAADALPVRASQSFNRHGNHPGGEDYTLARSGANCPQNPHNRIEGQLAQLNSWAVLLLSRSWPILRVTWVTVLAALIFLRWSGYAMTALLLGQLAQAAVEYRRVYRRTRAPRKGPA